MDKVIREGVVRVGVDLAKRVLQVHAVDAHGRVVTRRALRRDAFLAWCAQLPPDCVVAMEISSSAHHWARKLAAMGLKPLLMSAQLVKPYRSEGATGKNDANDAAAICEAASRPTMRFVPVKSIEQQSMLCLHRLREGLKADRTGCINRIRGLLAEFGLVFAQSPEALSSILADVLEDGTNEMNALARRVIGHARRSGASSTLIWPGATSALPSTPRTTPQCARPPSCWGSAPLLPVRRSPRSTTLRSSRMALNSAPGAASRPVKTRVAARPGWAASRGEETPICEVCCAGRQVGSHDRA